MRLKAIDGANPLGFLCALGTMRLAQLLWPKHRVRLGWAMDGVWQPELDVPCGGEDEFCTALRNGSNVAAPIMDFEAHLESNNITVSPTKFRQGVTVAAERAASTDRRLSDFYASFGSEVTRHEDLDRIQYTDLCLITGSGRQDFLLTAKKLALKVTTKHIHEALFGVWANRDRRNSFRWNPKDAKKYAMQWKEPSDEGASTVWGANWLAFEALPFYPSFAVGKDLQTTGFLRKKRQSWPEFSWPIWEGALTMDTMKSLLAHPGIHKEVVNRELLDAIGVKQVYRAERVRIGEGAHFKVSFREPVGL